MQSMEKRFKKAGGDELQPGKITRPAGEAGKND